MPVALVRRLMKFALYYLKRRFDIRGVPERERKTFYILQIEEVTTVFNKPAAPGGWVRLAHPEGACYYHHPEKRVYTDSYINDPDILNRIMDDITRLERLQRQFSESFPQDATLMIDVNRADEGNLETSYYYADHSQRTIFFLHPLEAWDIGAAHEVKGIKSHRHLGYEMQAQYWYFISLYPDSNALTTAMICELRDVVLYLIGDTMTSPYSTSPYTLDDLIKILGITGEMEKNALIGYPGTMALFARHMYIFGHTRFLNCHGESFARIERNFSIFGDPLNKRTWLVKTLSFILFSAPDVHLRNLQKMWVDGMMHKSVWEQTMKNLNDEWQEFVFFATVMLTSNVGFLAIQSVDTDNNPFRSAAQILSYLSVVTNIGTLILGLLLMRQNRTKKKDTADDVQEFLKARNHPRLGLETLAILYSLPYALLMWGVVAFLGAFCCVFFQNSNVQTRSLVGSLALAVSILIVWCVITSWEKKNHTEEKTRPLSYEEIQEPDEEAVSESPKPKYSIFDKIRSLPVLNYIRRASVDSGQTVV
ncbi:hypothetical protein BDN70DRAFT_705879 [Pholiota conissans]|uniref:Uncharacterized protein n=1 Tax=Pholiota conissans TaxID=109636 RepID=A0A9P5ZBI8_9AGAR|nr:hypothetical protein BDN70DRAFT_705879 [Pholiota conissans]